MTTARLFSATAAVAAGLALLSSGGGSLAGWYDELEIPGATITSGELRVEGLETSASVNADAGTVVAIASAKLHVDGDALAANLALDVAGFTPADPKDLTVEVTADRDLPLSGTDRSWVVDEMYDDVMVTARISLPAADAKAITGQPQVTWRLSQTAPGEGWYSEAVQEISFVGLWPTVPTFPGLACTPAADGSITLSWTWDGEPTERWEVVERNSAGNHEVIRTTITPDGRTVYSVTIATQTGNWLYSVRAIQDGKAPETVTVTRTSCATVDPNGS